MNQVDLQFSFVISLHLEILFQRLHYRYNKNTGKFYSVNYLKIFNSQYKVYVFSYSKLLTVFVTSRVTQLPVELNLLLSAYVD